ncbi:MAG: AAA family ATPase, partial [Cyanobacteria bacterium J06636_27]
WLNANHQQVEAEFFLISEWIKSAIINFSFDNSSDEKLMILLGVNASLLPEIGASIPVFAQKLPTEDQIACYLEAEFSKFTREDCKSIASTLGGLYIGSIHKIIAATLLENAFTNLRFIKQYLLNKKTEILQKFYGVEFLPPSSIKLGGYELMQEAFRKYKLINTPLGKAYNLSLPKGILLVGPPGTGKSHSAKVCSQIVGLPLIVVDWGHFRSYGNAAELKLKNLLALADTINRVILYFDDLDKGFAGGDDLAMRLAGKLLTWMQERTSDVIVFASANRMEVLPPELTRSGRFDEIFQIDLPNNEERYAIFNIHLARFDNRFVSESESSPYTDSEWRRILRIR